MKFGEQRWSGVKEDEVTSSKRMSPSCKIGSAEPLVSSKQGGCEPTKEWLAEEEGRRELSISLVDTETGCRCQRTAHRDAVTEREGSGIYTMVAKRPESVQ